MTATNEGWCHPASFIAASIHGSMFLMQQEMQQTHTETETELRSLGMAALAHASKLCR